MSLLAALATSCSDATACGPDTCFGCCSAEGLCSACPSDGGAGGGEATGGGSAVGGGSAGGSAVGGGSAGGSAGGGHAGGSAGGSAGGAAGGNTGPCVNGTTCTLSTGGQGVCCANTCKEWRTDVNNCGSCGVLCTAGASCTSGTCSPSCDGGTCGAGTQCSTNRWGVQGCYPTTCGNGASWCSMGNGAAGQCCGASCADVYDDVNNCGGCGSRCGAGQDCFLGSCTAHVDCAIDPAGTNCKQGATIGSCCAGQCVSLKTSTDRDNCGGCGLHCPVGDVCLNDTCAKPDGGFSLGCYQSPGQCAPGTSCNRSNTKCVTQTCGPGTYDVPCSGPGVSTCCGTNSCIDLDTSNIDCGRCGHACGAGQFCNQGTCAATPTCGPTNSGVDCPTAGGGVGTCCSGACVSTNTAANCGACGVQCPTGGICADGCKLADAGSLSCVGVAGACPAGTSCAVNRCLPLTCAPGSTGQTCEFGLGVGSHAYQTVPGRCCNGACVDSTQDPQNCNGCGVTCTSGLCVAGGIFGDTGSCFAPASSDCQFSCPNNMFCAGGHCTASTCQAQGFSGGTCLAGSAAGLCCAIGFLADCVNPLDDTDNCGGCGISCGSGGTCVNGKCSTIAPPCTSGHLGQFCDLDAGTNKVCCPGGGCIDIKTDDQNCGRCGNTCSTGLTCVGGGCLALTCTAATQNQLCPGDASTIGNCCASTCVDRKTDVANCGSCGLVCVGSETCADSACGIDTCDLPSQGAVCHRDAGTGIAIGHCCSAACIDTGYDRNNCGACGRVCPADAGCFDGNCQ